MNPSIPYWPLVAVVVLTLSACAHRPLVENVHTVVPDMVFRSAQLSGPRFEALIAEKKIKTVLNLRGASPGEAWYDDEIAAARKTKVVHHDLALDATKELTDAQILTLIDLMREAPKPMLIHCYGGADRPGLASALYLYEMEKRDPKLAAKALSLRYYHLWMFAPGAMDRSFDAYVAQKVALAKKREAVPAGPGLPAMP